MIDCCFSSSVVGVRGAWDYRSMLVCRLLMQHWIKEDLPVAQLLQANHTVFSEESGEIALSVLVHSQPPNTHTELTTTRNYWQLTHQRYTALRSGLDLPRHKKHRVIGTNLSFSLLFFLSIRLYSSSLLAKSSGFVDNIRLYFGFLKTKAEKDFF